MPPAASISGIRDNHSRGSVGDFLRQELKAGADLDLVTAYFTIFAYDKLRTELNQLGKIRLLFGEAAFIKSVDPDKRDGAAYVLRDDGLALASGLNQRHLARACAEWIREKVDVRSVTKTGFLHGKMAHIRRGEVWRAILGSSNFTTRGLGLAATNNNVELNLIVDNDRDREDLKRWFDELWHDSSRVECVKQQVLDYLLQVYADQSPEFIYYKTLFELFRRYIDEGVAIDESLHQLRLPDTAIWKALYSFQRDGARSAINKIKQYNGCILADSVGLGKTYTALAVIRYFELRNEKVLVLCPKKLRRNWIVYRQPSALNPFERDRFRFDVLHHTDVSRDSGESNGLLLSGFNWGAYDLVVIDESHNFRNNKQATQRPGDKEIRRTRYERLMDEIIRKGIRTKVLLLSATPVNNQLADLRNQISFIAGGDVARDDEANAAFEESLGVASVRDTTRLAQTHFTRWADPKIPASQRKTRDLIAAIGGDFFKLLDGLSIARSRRQIATYYAAEMKQLGGFPKRPPPKAIHAPIDLKQSFLSFEQLDTEIGQLRLALYHPTSFLRSDLPAPTAAAYQAKIHGGFTQEGREKILVGMMKINFLKRLESSVDSFRLTLERTIAKIDTLEKRITDFEAHLNSNPELDFDSLTPAEFEDPDFDGEDFTIGGRRRIHLGHLKLPEWLKAVRHDRTQLQFLLEKTKTVSPPRDGKLAELKGLIAEKVVAPTVNRDGKANRKVLIFTAFADTARYLYTHLAAWSREELKIHAALIRLLTRVIFCWFLVEKRLIPTDLFREHRLKTLLKDFTPSRDPQKPDAAPAYYRAILQNLFFGTLNMPPEQRAFREKKKAGERYDQNYGITNLWRYETAFRHRADWEALAARVPFLNGGLFDCLDDKSGRKKDNFILDGFSDREDFGCHLPNDLFFGPERTVDLSPDYGEEDKRTARSKRAKVRGLIEILSRYKFTIEENTPLEEEIALDPELLGKVFENLLASYNEDTRTTARKALGAFYTPREIVSYMVDEALKSYLASQVPRCKGALDDLFSNKATLKEIKSDTRDALIAAIGRVKILDPACGSGAFPMGALHRLVDLLQKLDPNNESWKRDRLAEARRYLRDVLRRLPAMSNQDDLAPLTPALWQPA